MKEDMWPYYKLDFIYFQLKIDSKEHGFLFDFMSAIEQKDRDKLRLKREEFESLIDSNYLPYAIPTLHFQFHLHHKFIQSHSTILELLNEIELKSTYDPNKWKGLKAATPVDLLTNEKSDLLCQYILDVTFSFFLEMGRNRERFNSCVLEFNSIYMKMVIVNKLHFYLIYFHYSLDCQ